MAARSLFLFLLAAVSFGAGSAVAIAMPFHSAQAGSTLLVSGGCGIGVNRGPTDDARLFLAATNPIRCSARSKAPRPWRHRALLRRKKPPRMRRRAARSNSVSILGVRPARKKHGQNGPWLGPTETNCLMACNRLRPSDTSNPECQTRLIVGPFADLATTAKLCASLIAQQMECRASVFEGHRLVPNSPAYAAKTTLTKKQPRQKAAIGNVTVKNTFDAAAANSAANEAAVETSTKGAATVNHGVEKLVAKAAADVAAVQKLEAKTLADVAASEKLRRTRQQPRKLQQTKQPQR